MSPRLVSAILAAAFMTVPLALPAQQRTPRFETTTSVMRIQVRVVDEQGSFVSGLAASCPA